MNIVILGAPGSGKGTQSAFLLQKYQLTHLSTGDLLRQEIANKSELGLKVQTIINNGELVQDDLIFELISNKISDKGALFDGFPRTIEQAKYLDKLLAKYNQVIDFAIFLQVDAEEILQRMLKRGRSDDNHETIKNRLAVFEKQTKPVIDFYQDKLITIEAVGEMQEIADQIINKINNKIK